MKIMLLAAGRGERMRPLTDRTPKPLIVWHIEKLVRAGITELVINHAHLSAQIKTALGDGSRFGVHIQYSPEACALETAGGIANALTLLLPSPASRGGGTGGEGEPFAVTNSGIYCDYDFAHLPERSAPPSLLSYIPRGSIAPLAPLLRAQITLGKVSGEYHRGL